MLFVPIAPTQALGERVELVVEAEAPMDVRSSIGSFARPFEARWASDRKCLVGFNDAGRVSYAFDVPETGEWALWLRYAAVRDVEIGFGFGGIEAVLETGTLASTGAFEGKHAWDWSELGRANLSQGRVSITLSGAPIRPDALRLAPANAAPPDDTHDDIPDYDEETLAKIADPLIPLRPAWIERFSGYRAPPWYESSRVSLHTRLSPRWIEHATFVEAEQAFASIGASSYVRHVRTGGEGAWWPSAVGAVAPWAEEDPVRAMVERAHEAGLRFVGYYRHLEDFAVAREHPDWLCRDDLGRELTSRNTAPRVCLSSPYADELLTRLEELAARGADGIYFDEDHVPHEGCFCDWCRALWTELTDLPYPKTIDDEDPLYRKLAELADWKMERFFVRVRERLRSKYPDLALVIGNYHAPDLFDRHASSRLPRLADGVKTEYAKGDSHSSQAFFRIHPELWSPPRATRLTLGWTFCRDAAGGRAPHVWINNLHSAAQARAAAAAVVAWGGVANLDVKEERLPDANVMRPALELADGLGRALAGTRPVRWVGVHFPERARDRTGTDLEAWNEVLAPLFGAWHELLGLHIPAGLVTDSQLASGELETVRVLFLPAPTTLTSDQRVAVEAFRERGGLVLEQDPGWGWNTRNGRDDAGEEFRRAIQRLVTNIGVLLQGGSPSLQLVVHQTPDAARTVIALVNDPAWIWTDRRTLPGGKPIDLPAGIDVQPEPIHGVTLRVPGVAQPIEVEPFDALWWRELAGE